MSPFPSSLLPAGAIFASLLFVALPRRAASSQEAVLARYHARQEPGGRALATPREQGWSEQGNGNARTVAVWDAAKEGEVPAWRIDNISPAENGAGASYRQKLDRAAFIGIDAWTATARLRVPQAPSDGPNVSLTVNDGRTRWQTGIYHNPVDRGWLYYRAGDDRLVPVAELDPVPAYFTLQMVYDGEKESAQLYLDGRPVGEPLRREQLAAVPENRCSIEWGDGDASPRLHRVDSYWNRVELVVGSAVIPRPGSKP